MNKSVLIVLLFLSFLEIKAQNFKTSGNGIRNTIVANIKGKECLYISEIDGAISCYTLKGKKLWRNTSPNPAVLFEIVAADVDGDGNEDVLAASGDGNLYCWKSDGSLYWKFNPGIKVRLSEVAVIGNGKTMRIFTGGNNYKLYEIDRDGELISETKIKGVVRKLESGYFTNTKKEELFLFTLKNDKYSSHFFGYIDPISKKTIKEKKISKILDYTAGLMIQDVSIADVNKDGKDDVLVFGSVGLGNKTTVGAIDGNLNKIMSFVRNTKLQRYAYTKGACLLPFKDEIVLQMGGLLYVIDLKGNLKGKSGMVYRGIIYNDLLSVPKSGKLIGSGQIGGGNGVYSYDLKKNKWWTKEHKLIGIAAQVEKNLNTLYSQILDYSAPSYQKKSSSEFVMLTRGKEASQNKDVEKLKGYQTVKFVKHEFWDEGTSRDDLAKIIGKDAYKRDRRRKYKTPREEIIERARIREKNNEPFVVWAGHGTDPFFLRIETMEEIVKVAPNTCYGFSYAEMVNVKDPRVIHFVNEYVPRVAKAIRKYKSKAKLYFRYKSMFWAADSHTKLWKQLFFSNKYNDILVPSAEDTNSRLQDLNFSGRVGMFASGYVNDYAIRLVDDNPTSWRPLSPGGQRSISPYLRNAAIMAAYGSRFGLIHEIKYAEGPALNIFYALMKSGVLPLVEREDILSIGSWHLIKDVDEEYLDHFTNEGHNLLTYSPKSQEAFVSLTGVNWSGASVEEYDYSKVALGVNYRWLNFIPEMPNGMVPITSVDYESVLKNKKKNYSVSNINHGYVNGEKISGKKFGTNTAKNVVLKGAEDLLVKVKGASWSLVKIGEKHARLILIDQGYVDPQNREVEVSIQKNEASKIIDVLSKEKFTLSNNQFKVVVPAGSMRFIDIEFNDVIE